MGAHILDVDNELMEEDLGSLVADNVVTDVVANVTPFKFLSS